MKFAHTLPPLDAEWIEADGLGGFASGTVSGIRKRRYHAILLPATTPPAGRMVLVNGFDAVVETTAGVFPISSQNYAPGVVHPDGAARIESFSTEPWPTWTWRLTSALTITQELFVPRDSSTVCIAWRLHGKFPGQARLRVRPFLSVRDFHGAQHENHSFRFDAAASCERVAWRAYEGTPEIISRSNATYRHDPCWYRDFSYNEEEARGLDAREDLASPGEFSWDLAASDAFWILSSGEEPFGDTASIPLRELFEKTATSEQTRRASFPSPQHRAADAYLVARGSGSTIIAGYPWFGDWGRDTFIALRGLGIASGRLAEAREILLEWAGAVSEGMLPNRFPDRGETPEFNSVDASLWYIIAVHEYLLAAAARPSSAGSLADDCQVHKLFEAVEAILEGYSSGTRFSIHADEDALLACGDPGVQLTWMDAKVGDWVVTPRIGKPVEVQCLWINALWIGSQAHDRWKDPFIKARASFRRRFWNEATGGLYDVVDCDHQPGSVDPAVRPNQIFAVGGLPLALLDGERAQRIVELVEKNLLTPIGLRSLAPTESSYAPRYEGGVWQRDGSYHQGTVWPWLIGPFVEAWLRVRGGTSLARAQAHERFLAPLRAHFGSAGLGHISEIADAEFPHTPRGCPFQAWSLAEFLRLETLLEETGAAPLEKKARRRERPHAAAATCGAAKGASDVHP